MKLIKTFALLAAVSLLLFGCKKNHNVPPLSLTAQWAHIQPLDQANAVVQTYDFKDDGTVEIRTTSINPRMTAILFFYSRQTGNYSLNGSQLSLSNLVTYTIPAGSAPYVPLSQLVVEPAAPKTAAFTLAFSAKRDSIALTAQCPPYADCIGLEWFKKQ